MNIIMDIRKTPVIKDSEKGFWKRSDTENFQFFYPVGPTKPPSNEGFKDTYKSQRTIRRLVASSAKRRAKREKGFSK